MHSDVASVLGLLAFVSVVTAASCNAEAAAAHHRAPGPSAGGGAAGTEGAAGAFGGVGPATNTSAANAMASR